MPGSIWQQRFTEYVKRVTDRRESTSLVILDDVMPSLPVLDPAAPELRSYRGEVLGHYLQTIGAVAAQYAGLGIFAPGAAAGPAGNVKNVVLVVNRVKVWTSGASGVEMKYASNAIVPGGSQAGTGAGADRRNLVAGVTKPTQAVFSSRSNAAQLGIQVVDKVLGAASQQVFEGPWVMTDGGGLFVEADTVNVALTAVFDWYERSSPSEVLG